MRIRLVIAASTLLLLQGCVAVATRDDLRVCSEDPQSMTEVEVQDWGCGGLRQW